MLSVVRADPVSAARGATLIALGIPVYYWYAAIQSKDSKQKAKESTEPL